MLLTKNKIVNNLCFLFFVLYFIFCAFSLYYNGSYSTEKNIESLTKKDRRKITLLYDENEYKEKLKQKKNVYIFVNPSYDRGDYSKYSLIYEKKVNGNIVVQVYQKK